ncbi:unnamed protein product [Spirodela intermedia]|uniref:BHLH domain-containing protein n=1 Tax=Spirodela intermedia TaxID=51605 RepID=A0A7I8L3Q1_SPIIN|nr:unnamed protein product [Spirodela intermedia]
MEQGGVGREEEDEGGGGLEEGEGKGELGLATFKSILEDDWCFGHGGAAGDGGSRHQGFGFPGDPSPTGSILLQSADSSSSESQPSVFNLEPSSQPFFPHNTRASLSSIFNVVCSDPFDAAGFDLGGGAAADDHDFLAGAQLSNPALLLNSGCPDGDGGGGAAAVARAFGDVEGSPFFFHRPKVLQPLDILPPLGAPPTLFQKRAAALRQSSELGGGKREEGGFIDVDEGSFDCSGMNYDSDETATPPGANNGEGDPKGKRKGMPAKNLMAERRRRKKLNDRLYMLRSVVPKISKMDRASILGDAIEYLKELLQKINDLHGELTGTPSSSPLPGGGAASFHPLTPTPPTLPHRVKEELCPSPLPSPSSQLPKVEVREREGRAVNIHMFCPRRPGLLLATMRALENLGLDVQQAVISCFNGFALDIFRAEPCNDSPRVRAEEIKAVLLHSAGCLASI